MAVRIARSAPVLALVGLIVLLTQGAAARPLGERVKIRPPHCPAEAVCGRLARPLDPSGVVPGKVQIDWRMYPHTGPVKAGVIVAQEGGPGYPTLGSWFEYLMLFKPLMDQYDLLLINARGTGENAVVCPTLDKKSVRTVDDVAACGKRLGPAAVLYGTRLAAQDMKAVLDELGITEINLYGDSYGTFFSQVFMALYPNMLRSVVLDGAYPVIGHSPWYPENAHVVNTAFDLACMRSNECASPAGQFAGPAASAGRPAARPADPRPGARRRRQAA